MSLPENYLYEMQRKSEIEASARQYGWENLPIKSLAMLYPDEHSRLNIALAQNNIFHNITNQELIKLDKQEDSFTLEPKIPLYFNL